MLSDRIIPRLRRLAEERGFSRSSICNYLGVHTNTLWRLDDDEWSPRLDTVKKIERFLARFEKDPSRVLSGEGWRIDYRDDQWWITYRYTGQRLGPFTDPDKALRSMKATPPELKTPEQESVT